MRKLFTKTSRLFVPVAMSYAIFFSANGYGQTNAVPMTTDTICIGDTVKLAASSLKGSTVTFAWADTSGSTTLSASTGDTVSVFPTKTTHYRVIEDSLGTKDTIFFTVTVNARPTVKMTLSDTMPCFRDTLLLFGSGAKTYTWGSTLKDPLATGDTVSDISLSPRKYWVSGVDSNGCIGVDTAVTSVRLLPRERVQGYVGGFSLGINFNVCNDELLTVKANHGRNTYTWGPSGTVTPTTGPETKLTVITATAVTLKIDSSNGCSINLTNTYFPSTDKPALSVTWRSDSIICFGDTAKVEIGGAVNYSWTPSSMVADSTASNAKLTPNVTTVYTVKGLKDGCTGEKTVKVIINPLPDITLSQSSNGNILCADVPDTITILSSTGVVFDWGFGVLSSGKIKSLLPGKTSTITIAALSAQGCRKDAQITINVDTTCGVRVGLDNAIKNSDINTYMVDGGELHLKFGSIPSGNVDVEVINLTGTKVLRFPLGEITSNENRVLNVSDLPSGVYLLKVSGKDYEIVNKIMR